MTASKMRTQGIPVRNFNRPAENPRIPITNTSRCPIRSAMAPAPTAMHPPMAVSTATSVPVKMGDRPKSRSTYTGSNEWAAAIAVLLTNRIETSVIKRVDTRYPDVEQAAVTNADLTAWMVCRCCLLCATVTEVRWPVCHNGHTPNTHFCVIRTIGAVRTCSTLSVAYNAGTHAARCQ